MATEPTDDSSTPTEPTFADDSEPIEPEAIQSLNDLSVEDLVGPAEENEPSDEAPEQGHDEEAEPEATYLNVEDLADQLVVVKVDGEEQEVTLGDAVDGYMRQADYTRKTQELAANRNRLQTLDALEAAFDRDPQGTLETLASQYGVTLGGATTEQGTSPDELESLDPLERQVHELRSELQAVKAEEARRQEAAQRAQIEADFDAVRTKYQDPDLDFAELVSFASTNGIGNLDMAYRAMRFGAEQQQKQPQPKPRRQVPPVEGGRPRARGAARKGPAKVKSIEDALDAAMAELTG